MYKQVLITGGAGFVGSSLAIRLKTHYPDINVTTLDNLHRRGSELNLPRLKAAGIVFEHGDIRCPSDLRFSKKNPELIIECSAEPSAQAGYGGSPDFLIQTNLNGCYHCLELARETKADFIFISTSRVYPVNRLNQLAFEETASRFALKNEQTACGASVEGISEDFSLEGARSLYGMTKLAGELMVTEYADAYSIRAVVNRCGVIAGPWQMGKTDQGVIALWVAAHHFHQPLKYIGFGGSGKQVRDVLHVDDLCDLIEDQIQNMDLYAGRLFNAGGGLQGSLSLREMTDLCRNITGNHVPVTASGEARAADIRIFITDTCKLTAFRQWRPRRNPETVLSDIHDWIKREEKLLKPVLSPA
jgi:CDP-paratose 2-epimerase